MNRLYPEIEPYDQGILDVSDGNHIYWEVCGSPTGKPAVIFHGGPGSGCVAGWRRYFNPATYRAVLFDQRGCGRSTPHASDPAGDLVAAYYRLLHDQDAAVREKAARDWCRWEDAHVALRSDHRPDSRYDDPRFRMAFARLVTHYWHHTAFLEDGALLRDAGRLAGIPGVLIHGRLDLSSPLDVPCHLSQAWPGSELRVIDDAGHGTGQRGMREAVISAIDRFAVPP